MCRQGLSLFRDRHCQESIPEEPPGLGIRVGLTLLQEHGPERLLVAFTVGVPHHAISAEYVAVRLRGVEAERKTIPIVVGRAEGDLVAAGLVDSLARPGGNITGSQILNDDLVPKRLELLKALVPNLSKIALLREDVTTSALPQIGARYDQQTAIAGRSLGIEVHTFIVRRAGDLAGAFLGMMKTHSQGVLVTSSVFMFVHRQAIVDLAAAHRIAAVYELQVFVEPGGLMSYGINVSEMQRRAAVYVDRILKGAKPADLPIEQPTQFELAINLKTAKALRLTIPQSLLLRADQVIQ